MDEDVAGGHGDVPVQAEGVAQGDEGDGLIHDATVAIDHVSVTLPFLLGYNAPVRPVLGDSP